MKITVLGAGAWGTALAKLLNEAQAGHEIILWGHDATHLRDAESAGRNERYLPGIALPREMKFEADLSAALAATECVVVAVPSRAFRKVTESLRDFSGPAISVT